MVRNPKKPKEFGCLLAHGLKRDGIACVGVWLCNGAEPLQES